MSAKIRLVTLFTAMLLALLSNGVNWQGTGSGINNTVIAKAWETLEADIVWPLRDNRLSGLNDVAKGISDKLNDQWDPAWNVVLINNIGQYDSILYGYAFRNQWMWYNGVPHNSGPSYLIALIVWKDYNCRDWRVLSSGTSTLTSAQKNRIGSEINRMTRDDVTNNIWGTAYTMMTNLQNYSEFSSGGWTVIMNQYSYSEYFGYVCRVGDNFYNSITQLGRAIVSGSNMGSFILFQTR